MTLLTATLPSALVEEQLALDGARFARFPDLAPSKRRRLSASALGLLRGAAPLFYRLLAAHPALADGPAGEGWLCGDLHVENFGAFRITDGDDADDKGHDKARRVTFDLNDFDEAAVGPWRLDLLRLTTSAILATGLVEAPSGEQAALALEVAQQLFDGYRRALDGAALPSPPPPVQRLLGRAAHRSRQELLDARTELAGGARRFQRGPRYRELAPATAAAARRAFQAYAASALPGVAPEALTIVDVAQRIAGTGSLGCLRVAVLVAGKGGKDGGWIFDMKEEGTPAPAALLGDGCTAGHDPAARVLAALRAALEHPPRNLGSVVLDEGSGAPLSMLVRRLAPQEDKLDLLHVEPAALGALIGYLGALTGRAHRRGAQGGVRAIDGAGWSAILDRAFLLAGLHEAVHLAWLRRFPLGG